MAALATSRRTSAGSWPYPAPIEEGARVKGVSGARLGPAPAGGSAVPEENGIAPWCPGTIALA
jgi:hypothetical protein